MRGQSGNGRNQTYRYYWIKENKIRIKCEELDKFIVDETKHRFQDNVSFDHMVEDAFKRRQLELPKVEKEINRLKREIVRLEDSKRGYLEQLKSPPKDRSQAFFDLVIEGVTENQQERERALADLVHAESAKAEIQKKNGLIDVKKSGQNLLAGFDKLTPPRSGKQ